MEWVRRFLLRLVPGAESVVQVNKGIRFGVYEMQGRRPYMEDTHICVPCLSSHVASPTIPKDVRLFAVFDGHGGDATSTYARQHFPSILAEQLSGDHTSKILGEEETISEILVHTLKETHDRLLQDHPNKFSMDGCTAVVCLEYQGSLWTANLGDSRAVLCREGRTVPLTDDHSPMSVTIDNSDTETGRQYSQENVGPDEYNRIYNAGGFVYEHGCPRVYRADGGGGLALSRALGDEYYNQNGVDLVPVDPEVTFETLDDRDQFILLFTDGLLESFSSEEMVERADFLSRQVDSPEHVAQTLVLAAFQEGSTDNLTCIYWDLCQKE